MIIPMLISGLLFVTPVTDTVWWNTQGGKVTEHRDQTGATCSLMLYDQAGSVVFEWTNPDRILVTAIDWNWQFPADWKLPVAMQVGDVWLSSGGDSAVLQAVAHGNAVTFTSDQSVDGLLSTADHVVVKTTDSQLAIKLNQIKMGALLSHLGQCRDVMAR